MQIIYIYIYVHTQKKKKTTKRGKVSGLTVIVMHTQNKTKKNNKNGECESK